jgi:glycosyltransferase involved in cell wall biosynthesis
MTARNSQHTVGEAISSIHGQTYTAVELIFVDDHSSDFTFQIARKFEGNGTIVLRNNRAPGRATSLNLAASHASGKYLAIMDSDDIAEAYRLAFQVRALEVDQSIGILGGQIRQFGNWGSQVGISAYPVDDEVIRRWLRKGHMPLAHPTMVLRKAVFDTLLGYSEECSRAEDLEILLRANRFTRICNSSQVLTRYRVTHPGQSWEYWRRNDAWRANAVSVAKRGKGLTSSRLWIQRNLLAARLLPGYLIQRHGMVSIATHAVDSARTGLPS